MTLKTLNTRRFASKLCRKDIFILEDLHSIMTESYTLNSRKPVMHHLENMGMWTAWMNDFLPKRVEGHREPRVFLFKRDPDDGVVRHWYRQQMQTSKETQEDAYMPVNSKGFDMFPDGIPDIQTVYAVPFKPMDVVTLKTTVNDMMHRFRDGHVVWWRNLIEMFEFEDLQTCGLCKEFRKTIMANASHCNDAKELKRAKANAYKKASKELMVHMSRAEGTHPLFTPPAILLSPGRYLNPNWEQIGEEDAEVMISQIFHKIPEFLDRYVLSKNSGIFKHTQFYF